MRGWLITQTGSAVIPLSRIPFDVHKLPREKRRRIRVHSFYIRLFNPTDSRSLERNYRLSVEHVFLRFSQQLVTLLFIKRVIRFLDQVDVFLVPPAGPIISPKSQKDI